MDAKDVASWCSRRHNSFGEAAHRQEIRRMVSTVIDGGAPFPIRLSLRALPYEPEPLATILSFSF